MIKNDFATRALFLTTPFPRACELKGREKRWRKEEIGMEWREQKKHLGGRIKISTSNRYVGKKVFSMDAGTGKHTRSCAVCTEKLPHFCSSITNQLKDGQTLIKNNISDNGRWESKIIIWLMSFN